MPRADYVLVNSEIYTMNTRHPWAESVAVAGNRICHVGSYAETQRFITPDTNVVDLDGRFLMPGFIDAHIHLRPHMLPVLCEYGITSAQSIGEVDDVQEYTRLATAGSLTTRLGIRLPIESWESFPRCRKIADCTSGMVEVNGLKTYADGMFRNRTALLLEPYMDSTTNKGSLSNLFSNSEETDCFFDKAVSVGADISVHAIGDAGVRILLNHYGQLIKRHGIVNHRLRVVHASLVSPADFTTFGKLNLIAEVNPYHVEAIPWLNGVLGKSRIRWAFAFRTLKANGALLCFGSDAPGPSEEPEFPISPLLGIQSAVLHPNLDERITLPEALSAYTIAPAYATRSTNHKGTLEAGKLADMVVLSESPFRISPLKIGAIEVVRTYVGGKLVYSN